MSDEREPWMKTEEEEEEVEDETNYKSQKDAVIFAIDVSKSMLSAPSDPKGDSPTIAALKCASLIMQQRIISNPKDMMGVLLYGTEETKFQDDAGDGRAGLRYPHCYLLNELDVPSAEDVRTLKELVEDGEETDKLLTPTKETVTMSNLLFCANQIFTIKAPNFDSRRLFIITDNDDPHAEDKNARSQAAVRAKDLYDLGVIIELFPISHPDHEFDRIKFYDDIIYRDPNEGENAGSGQKSFKSFGEGGISLLNHLISDINSKQVAKRSLFSDMPFEIGPGLTISVKGYNILQKQSPNRSHYVYTGGEEAQIVVGETTKSTDDSTRVLDVIEIKKAYKFGGGQVLFTPEEQKELKIFGSPVIRIIGFKPQDQLPMWASVKKSTFIYPSENDYVGSIRVFGALWQKLLNDKRMGIAWHIPRAGSKPILVAILPSEEKLDDQGGQRTPQGLWLFPLPFADDIRQPADAIKPERAPDELVDEMRKVVQQLQLPGATYDPSRYPNPSLQWHYRILQAMALEEEVPEKAVDKTIGKHRQIDKRAGEYIQKWGMLLEKYTQSFAAERRSWGSVKRELDDEDEAPKKKIKKESHAQKLDSMSDKDIKALAAAGHVNKHTLPELKSWCSSKGLSLSGKKADLVERIEQWCEEN